MYNQGMSIKNFSVPQSVLNKVLFTPGELRQVLSAYAEGVLQKGWKDYALDTNAGQSIFSVIDHQGDSGSVALYSFSKNKPQSKNSDRHFYRIFHREAQVLRTESFLEALEKFRELDKKGGPKKKGKDLKIIQ